MKYRDYLKAIDGVSFYPMFTLLLFFLIFVLALLLVFGKSKKTINQIKNLPFEDGEEQTKNKNLPTNE